LAFGETVSKTAAAYVGAAAKLFRRRSPSPHPFPRVPLRSERRPGGVELSQTTEGIIFAPPAIGGRAEFKSLWAALPVLASFLPGADAAQQGVKVDQEKRIFAPTVRALIEQVLAAQERHASAVAEHQNAETAMRDAARNLESLKASITERETELARAGASLPEEPLPEEIQARTAERQMPVLGARVRLCGERVAAATAEVARERTSLDEEFARFGREEYLKLREQFLAASVELRRLHSRLVAWPRAFWGRGTLTDFPPAPTIIIENPMVRTIEGRFVINSNLADTPGDAELYASLQALRSEIDRLKTYPG